MVLANQVARRASVQLSSCRLADRPGRGGYGVSHAQDVANSLRKTGALRQFVRNSMIFGEGEEARYVYQLIEGVVRTFKVLRDGRRQLMAFAYAGDFLGFESLPEHSLTA